MFTHFVNIKLISKLKMLIYISKSLINLILILPKFRIQNGFWKYLLSIIELKFGFLGFLRRSSVN